ncbi:unnamed protein product [Blepharisma stoltei]|uniref:Uncharacterized protein n=1 Tax=Blepharisma stoltei TaxID=1481888 RepID=A0AAU9IV44_9CILI|nr:unnamed protein product [Blepharisma stoltei]
MVKISVLKNYKMLPSMGQVIAKTIPPFWNNPSRKSRHESCVLSLFYNPKSPIFKPPKKEYLRCKLIRGHKRILRQIKKCIIPAKTLNRIDPSNPSALRQYEALRNCYYRNADELDPLTETVKGPITDGRAKRKSAWCEDIENSFNMSFCRSYFAPNSIRESYFLYVELIFMELDAEVLCDKFDFHCCREKNHSGECIEKWLLMKNIIQFDMIRELDHEPIVCSEIILPNYGLDKLKHAHSEMISQANM